MDLSNLKPAEGATKTNKRLGRGVGSGKGGHTASRGNKGQTSRAGHRKMPAWFEGGQMPLQRRIPKFGFKNRFRTEYRPVNVSWLQRLVDEGRINPDMPVTPKVLARVGAVREGDLVKILGNGELTTALVVAAHRFSKSAQAKIEAAGGNTTVLQ